MASVLTPPTTVTLPQRFIIDGVTWEQYVTISDALTPQRGLRLTYDGARLELMTLSFLHERFKKLLGRLIESLALELDIDLQCGGSTTFRREDVERGLEPDECYWIANADQMIEVSDWNPTVHPPPDLAVEIDVASSSLNRREIYARLGVPELWRFDGKSLAALRLNDAGDYEPIEYSLAFPFLLVRDLQQFLLTDPPASNTSIVRRFLDWLRERSFEN